VTGNIKETLEIIQNLLSCIAFLKKGAPIKLHALALYLLTLGMMMAVVEQCIAVIPKTYLDPSR
jgi:hypothetical protein